MPEPEQGREKRSWENAFPSLPGLTQAAGGSGGGEGGALPRPLRARKEMLPRPFLPPRDIPAAPRLPLPGPAPLGPPRAPGGGRGAAPLAEGGPSATLPLARAAAGPAPLPLCHWPPGPGGPRRGPAPPGSFKFMEENK